MDIRCIFVNHKLNTLHIAALFFTSYIWYKLLPNDDWAGQSLRKNSGQVSQAKAFKGDEEGLEEVGDKHEGSIGLLVSAFWYSYLLQDGKRRKLGKPVIYDPAAKENHRLKCSRARAHSISAQVPSEYVTY
ncbi:hypothetical protein MKW98_010556 [Papaver atlanticum]|uniref:Uncharacterized protein n=1 Tax=Papaver atlanticum TaxID=357466 RepID=A0AAD4S3K4_9MAGN|nr:hypothetical protein MKW98_010556 [Papaver atlanticum]